MDRFGESAPAGDLFKHFGFTRRKHRKSSQERIRMIKVAINGFGRIGRMVLRAHYERRKEARAAVRRAQRLGDAATNAHLCKYDTAHGRSRPR
jgi:hypothetical protein